MRRVAVALVVLLAGTARADDSPDELVAKGEQAAKAGDYSLSIVMFKAADKRAPHARNACMIGLAYLRREMWPQAEVFFAECRRRSTALDGLPDWLGDAEKLLADKLASVEVAPITIVVAPATANATISISSFTPDERFPPRLLHLAPGKHVVEVSAPGFATQEQAVVVATRDPQTIRITLHPPPAPPPPPSRVPLYVMGAGAVVGLAGGAYALFAVKPVYDELGTTKDPNRYDDLATTMRSRRIVEGALFAGAALTVGVGLVLRYTVFKREVPVEITAHAGNGGAGIAIGWTR